MFSRAMVENVVEERREETIAVANGLGLGFGGKGAYQSWLRGQDRPVTAAGPAAPTDAAERQRATLLRLSRLFHGQRNPALRDAIQIRRLD